MVALSPSPSRVEHADRHDLRAVGEAGDAAAVVGALADRAGDVRAVAVLVVGEAVVVDEVVAAHEVAAREVGRAAEAPAVGVRDAGVEHRHGHAAPAGAADVDQVLPGVGRVDAGAGEEVPLQRLPAAGLAGARRVVRDEGRQARRPGSARRWRPRAGPAARGPWRRRSRRRGSRTRVRGANVRRLSTPTCLAARPPRRRRACSGRRPRRADSAAAAGAAVTADERRGRGRRRGEGGGRHGVAESATSTAPSVEHCRGRSYATRPKVPSLTERFFARDEYFMRLAIREAERALGSTTTCRSAPWSSTRAR